MSSQVRERVSRFEIRSKSRVTRPFGLSSMEIVAACLCLLFFAVVVVYYFTSLRPEQARLRMLEEQLRQQDVIVSSNPQEGNVTAPPAHTAIEALSTLEAFKNERLRPLSSGRIALQNELNALIKKNNLQLTSGIETHVDVVKAEADQGTSRRRKIEDTLNVFPHQSVTFTVFGQYPNLRAFVTDLERNKQFLVIKSINLTTQEDREEGSGRRQRAAAASGIMLSVDLTAYFQP
jgi:hypothetical protein